MPPVFEVKKVEHLSDRILKDTLIYDPSQDEMENFRELISYKKIGEANYRITVRSMIVETMDIIWIITLSFSIILLAIFLLQIYLNGVWSRIIWQPFFKNLEQMKAFSVRSNSKPELADSDVLEFSELKEQIESLTQKVTSDYRNLKQFTENVSHELQTPLAIMQAKLENLVNESSTREQFQQLSSIQKDIQRLAKLNKKLVLLTKLDNQQFTEREEIDLNKMIRESLENFKEIAPQEIKYIEEKKIELMADTHLLQILCDNLISNAIKYCDEEGIIEVKVSGNCLSVSNSGKKAITESHKLFTRFYKNSEEPQKSLGLGLAIVKKICDLYQYSLQYSFSEDQHCFGICFPGYHNQYD